MISIGGVIFLILGIIIFAIFIEWSIGKVIGKAISKSAGLVLGIIFILFFPLFLMGIAIIVYSNKNDEKINVNIKMNNLNERNVTPFNNISLSEYNNYKKMMIPNNQNNNNKLLNKYWKIIFIENNLEKYFSIFEENNLSDLEILCELTESDLEKLGINIMGDRKIILKIFSELNINEINKNNLSDSEYISENEAEDIINTMSWICGICGTKNSMVFIDCKKCGKYRDG